MGLGLVVRYDDFSRDQRTLSTIVLADMQQNDERKMLRQELSHLIDNTKMYPVPILKCY